MNDEKLPPHHSVKKESKFCRCRICHEHFYAETIAKARQACFNLDKSVKPRRIAQALDLPNYAKKSLITVKVTTIFFATLSKSISCTLHPRLTDLSRLKYVNGQHPDWGDKVCFCPD